MDRNLARLVGGEKGVALLAVGGYGRGQLCPHSDLDLVLLHAGRRDVGPVAERIWYPIWDEGFSLDHSVRTVKEALDVAGRDIKVLLGLLDARLIAGDEMLARSTVDGARRLWAKRSAQWLALVAAEVADRRHRFGEVAFLLEPDIKEGYGGLRDAAALRAASLAGVVAPLEGAVAEATELLLSVRVELHRRVARASDRLTLEQQDGVAAALGTDADGLMAAVASSARSIAWASDEVWRRAGDGARRGRRPSRAAPVGDGLVVVGGEVGLAPDADAAGDPTLALRAASAAATRGVSIGHATLLALAERMDAPSDPWPEDLRGSLVDLLALGDAAVEPLESLDAVGLISRLLPEWEPVRSRPQRNAYHRFTVDRHLIETAVRAATLVARVDRPDLLLVGALLHDIGKGYPGDHTEAGMEVVAKVAARMGFPPDDVAVLVDMVRLHLLLPDVATRRDLDDPRTAETVAEAVGDRRTLELLGALTEADSLATGPSAWSEWKAGLVADLVERAGHVLDGRRLQAASGLSDVERSLAERGEVAVVVEGSTVTVVAPDRPGLLCRVAGALAVHGLDVLSARAASHGPMAVERFEVQPPRAVVPDWARVTSDIRQALLGRLAVAPRLAERAGSYSLARPQAAEPVRSRVRFDNSASESATVVEVRAADAVGVLYRITRALSDCDLDVRSALVSTMGHEVVDAFYVTDSTGAKLADAEHQREVERAILAELDR